jgi:hypothetical protein
MQLGMYSRLGQDKAGSACGAAVGALNYCCNPKNVLPTDEDLGANPHDYQMRFLIHEIAKVKDEINRHTDSNQRQAALALQTYRIAEGFLDKIVSTDFGREGHHGQLIILGGVQVNMPVHMGDFFLPVSLQVRQHGRPTVDLFNEAFPAALIRQNTCSEL